MIDTTVVTLNIIIIKFANTSTVLLFNKLIDYSSSILKMFGDLIITTVLMKRITLPLRLYALEKKNVRR